MSLIITTKDITTIECDAIVNPVVSLCLVYGNPCEKIHKVAGRKLLRECKRQYRKSKLDFNISEVLATDAFNLPCKNVIHLIKPIVYIDSVEVRNLFLRACYKNIFKLAKENHYSSIAIPLVAEDNKEYSRYEISKIAIDEIKSFLAHNEAFVYLVVEDKNSIKISESWRDELNGYVQEVLFNDSSYWDKWEENVDKGVYLEEEIDEFDRKLSMRDKQQVFACSIMPVFRESIVDMIKKMDDSFAVTLLKLIDEKHMRDVDCYKKANVSRQTWYKIMNDKEYKPSKTTIIAFAIALKLRLDETNALLATAGFTLSRSNKFDIIISYCIESQEYDIYNINEMLFEFDLPLLGV